ncbi:MAG TPA: hypothetical protein VFG35_07550 [Actinoplanes sp.]|nr:hypothetical protein [Actinoplanes sp.]
MNLYVLMARDSDSAELVYRLRGGPVFDALNLMRDGGLRVHVPGRTGAEVPTLPGRGHAIFADLSVMVDRPDRWAHLIGLDCPIILDVHFPLGFPDHTLTVQPGRTDEARDQEEDRKAQEYWSDLRRIDLAMTMVMESTVVTCPRRDWAEPISWVSRRRVQILPNVTDPESGREYTIAFLKMLDQAYRAKQRRLPLTRRHRIVARLIRTSGIQAMARRHVADKVMSTLEQSDIDWTRYSSHAED